MPELKIIHSLVAISQLPKLAECPNVMLDFSGYSGLRISAVENALKPLGPDRLLF